ncbi:MAG: hypothetical protein N4Q30_05285 [Neisseriaceae bacterium]|nr:hypothetical protein [Neisseriaceae bacterium]
MTFENCMSFFTMIGTVAVPIILLFWAPKINNKYNRVNKNLTLESIQEDTRKHIEMLINKIEKQKEFYNKKGYKVVISNNKPILNASTHFITELEIILKSYNDVMKDNGKYNITTTIKSYSAAKKIENMRKWQDVQREEWLESTSETRLTQVVAYKYFEDMAKEILDIKMELLN